MVKAASKPGQKTTKAAKPTAKKAHEAPFPPPEEEFGGGDFVSPVEAPPTDDDKPLE
ncbi:hypothetical protein [Bradyrhizobium sp. SYSU BS000235]|uniref:hypothetical protein n=1 Tax=Bradyrhizobium sp. SYSU BS000235 TaxID=3411332 RepID=UPI003C748A55